MLAATFTIFAVFIVFLPTNCVFLESELWSFVKCTALGIKQALEQWLKKAPNSKLYNKTCPRTTLIRFSMVSKVVTHSFNT